MDVFWGSNNSSLTCNLQHGMNMLRATTDSQLKTEISTLTRFVIPGMNWESVCKIVFDYRFRHPNLLPLMGYCTQPPTLVSPFMERGSLYRNLHKWKVIISKMGLLLPGDVCIYPFLLRLRILYHGMNVLIFCLGFLEV